MFVFAFGFSLAGPITPQGTGLLAVENVNQVTVSSMWLATLF